MSAKNNVNLNSLKKSHGKRKMQILPEFNKSLIYIPVQLVKTHKCTYTHTPEIVKK